MIWSLPPPLKVTLKRWMKPWRIGARKGFAPKMRSPRPLLCCHVLQTQQIMSVGAHRFAVPSYMCGACSPCLPMMLVLGTQRTATQMAPNVATTFGKARCQVAVAPSSVVVYGKSLTRHVLKQI